MINKNIFIRYECYVDKYNNYQCCWMYNVYEIDDNFNYIKIASFGMKKDLNKMLKEYDKDCIIWQ